MAETPILTETLGTGLGPDAKLFPAPSGSQPSGSFNLRGIGEFQRKEMGDAPNVNAEQVQLEVFNKSLNKEIDINSLYFPNDPIDASIISNAQIEQEKKNQNQPYDQSIIDKYKSEYEVYIPLNQNLFEGVAQTGAFPINLVTGEAIVPEGLSSFQKESLTKKGKQEQRLIEWASSQKGRPENLDVLQALARSFRPDMQANLARRVNDAIGGTVEVVQYYAPTLMSALWNKYLGTGEDFDFKKINKELNDFRYTGINKFITNMDRHRIVNDIIRDELRKTLSPEEFESRGYNKTVMTTLGRKVEDKNNDGIIQPNEVIDEGEQVKVPAINFVTPEFADKLFEFSFDEMEFFEKFVTIVGENVIGTKALTLPFKYVNNAIKTTRIIALNLAGKKIPFSLLKPAEQILASKKVALTMNISPVVAAKNIMLEENKKFFLNNIFPNRLAQIVGKNVAKVEVGETMLKNKEEIVSLRNQIDNAILSNKPQKDIDALTRTLDNMEANYNYMRVKKGYANLIDFSGLNPRQELTMSLVQVVGREWGGPVGEAYGIGAYLLGQGIKGTYGWGMTKVSGMNIPGEKQMPYIQGIPVISKLLNRAALNTKIWTEDFVTNMLRWKKISPNFTIKGMLVNPNLTLLKKLSKERKLPASFAIEVETFVNNSRKLPPESYDNFISDFARGIEDIDLIVKGLPDGAKEEFTNMLTGSLAEMTGLNVYAGIGSALDTASSKLSAGQVRRLGKTFKNKVLNQIEFEKRLTALTSKAEMLQASILKLENGEYGDVSQEVLNNLKMASELYSTAATKGNDYLRKIIKTDAKEAEEILKQIKNPTNGLLKLYTGGAAKSAIAQMFTLIRKSKDQKESFDADGTIEVETYNLDGTVKGKQLAPEVNLTSEKDLNVEKADLETKELSVYEHSIELQDSIKETSKRLNLTQNDINYINNSHSDIISLVSTIETTSKFKVENAYENISTQQKINFTNTANSIVELILQNKSFSGQSLASAVIPTSGNVLGGGAGLKIINNLEGGARRGLIAFFDNPAFLEEINKLEFLGSGIKFENGEDFYNAFKRHVENNPALYEVDIITDGKKLTDEDGLSALQMAMILVDPSRKNKPFNFSPEDFKLLASPMELENVRQAMQVLGKDKNENIARLANTIVSQLNIDFNRYANTISVDDINNIAIARTTHRLEQQRFDKLTAGGKIKSFMDEGEFKFVIDGDPITSKNLTDIFNPFIKEILNPSPKFNTNISNELQKIVATFAPTSDNLPPMLLKKDEFGRYVMPTKAELDKMAKQPTFDLNTEEGREGFKALNGTLQALLKAAFVSEGRFKRNIKIVGDIAVGNEPRITLSPYGSFEEFKLPPGVKNVADYIEKIEEAVKVNVIKQGNTDPDFISAIKIDELFDIDNQVLDTIMSSQVFAKEHQAFFKSLEKIQPRIQLDLDGYKELGGDFFKRTKLYKDNLSGETFFDKVLNSGDPNAFQTYIDDLDILISKNLMTVNEKEKILRGLFITTINTLGGLGEAGDRMVTMYNGTKVPVKTYATPEVPYALLTGGDESLKFGTANVKLLAKEAGVTKDQLETIEAIFRHGIRINPESLAKKVASGRITAAGTEAGFSLTNTLSKGFNLARGLISKEYVAADYAVRYAAMANNVVLSAVMNDNRAANIIFNMLEDPTLILKGDADYVARIFKSFIVTDLNKFGIDHEKGYDKKRYWASKGVTWETEN